MLWLIISEVKAENRSEPSLVWARKKRAKDKPKPVVIAINMPGKEPSKPVFFSASLLLVVLFVLFVLLRRVCQQSSRVT